MKLKMPANGSHAPLAVEYARDGSLAFVTLNRPEKLNAIDRQCLDLLRTHIEQASIDAAVRAIVISGRGRAFCSGADLEYVERSLRSRRTFSNFLARWHATLNAIAGCIKPTIAEVHGFALAGGLELTQACDFVIAGDHTELGDQHARYGLFPGGGSTQRLPRIVGVRRAKWLLMSGQRLSAPEALEIGLVNRVVPDARLSAETRLVAQSLAQRSASCNAAIKRAVALAFEAPLSKGLRMEQRVAVEYMLGPDARAGLVAFREGSEPNFGN